MNRIRRDGARRSKFESTARRVTRFARAYINQVKTWGFGLGLISGFGIIEFALPPHKTCKYALRHGSVRAAAQGTTLGVNETIRRKKSRRVSGRVDVQLPPMAPNA